MNQDSIEPHVNAAMEGERRNWCDAIGWPVILLAALYLVAVAGGIVIFLLPEPAPEPLVRADGWDRTVGVKASGIGRARPFGVREAIRKHPDVRFWTTDPDSPETLFVQTKPFTTQGPLIVPFRLHRWVSETPDANVSFNCLDNGKVNRTRLIRSGAFASELFIEIEPDFCAGQMTMVAKASASDYLIVGTPFSISRIEAWKRSVLAQVPRHAIVLLVLFSLGLAACLLVEPWCDPDRLPLVLVLAPLCAGYLSFFVFWWSPQAGKILVLTVVVGAIGHCLVTWLRRPDRLLRVLQPTAGAVLVWAAVSFFFVVLLYTVDLGAGAWSPNVRFSPARWFGDNLLPMIVGEAVYDGRVLDGLLGMWHVSDRGPLQSGVALILRPFAGVLMAAEEARVYNLYSVVGIILNTMWAYAGFLLCRALNLSRGAAVAVVVVLCLTPFAVFNSCFVWPKMLAGALGILALLAVLTPAIDGRRDAVCAGLPWLAAAAALSLLSHGGTVFFLCGMGFWMLMRTGIPRLRAVIAGLVVGCALLGPWMAWQKLVDPPGNALVKSVLAGTEVYDEEVGVWEAVVGRYREAGLEEWRRTRLRGLRQIVLGEPPEVRIFGFLANQRWRQFMFIVPALAPFFLLGLGTLIEPFPSRLVTPQRVKTLSACRHFLIITLLSLALSLLVQWRFHFIHHNSYSALLLLVLAATIGGTLTLGRFAAAMIAWSMTTTLVVWVFDPLCRSGGPLDLGGLVMSAIPLIAGIVVVTVEAIPRLRRPEMSV